MDNLSIDIIHQPRQSGVVTLRFKGFLYAATLAQADKTLQTVLTSETIKKLILDLTETNYISSGGWSLFLSKNQIVQKQGGKVVLAGMKPEVHDAFEFLEFDKIFKLFTTYEEALKVEHPKPSTLSGIS
jgi:anti-anti-sigma factor